MATSERTVAAAFATRAEVASVARLLARAGLVEAFGHVSARLERGGFALTSTRPLLCANADDVLELDEHGEVLLGENCPLEARLHAAVYTARADVGAICRTHSPYVALWASRGEPPPVLHGLGALSGDVVVYRSPQLVCDPTAAAAAAAALGHADCLLLRANGALCVGRELAQASVRAWFLEERARLADRAQAADPLTDAELAERARHFGAETERAWAWLQARFGDVPGDLSTTTDTRTQ